VADLDSVRTFLSCALVLSTYSLLVLAWCAGGKWFGSHPLILKALDRWGHWIVPFVLIGLSGYILLFTSH